jgi:hypothetical protein
LTDSTPATDDPLVSEGVIALQKLFIVLGIAGVAVPPVFQSLQAEQQIVSLLLALGALVWSALSHFKTLRQATDARAATAAALAPKPKTARGNAPLVK